MGEEMERAGTTVFVPASFKNPEKSYKFLSKTPNRCFIVTML